MIQDLPRFLGERLLPSFIYSLYLRITDTFFSAAIPLAAPHERFSQDEGHGPDQDGTVPFKKLCR